MEAGGECMFSSSCTALATAASPITTGEIQTVVYRDFLPVEPIYWFAVVGSSHPVKYVRMYQVADSI